MAKLTPRKFIINIIIFTTVLLTIVYLNRPSKKNIYTWNKVQYQSSSTLPDSNGRCPGISRKSDPALVVSRVKAEASEWLDSLRKQYHVCVYTADIPLTKRDDTLQLPKNRGHEAMGYLTFIIDNYDDIPDSGAVFVHGSRFAWHNDDPEYDNAVLLRALNISAALKPSGYHNLRCDWSSSTCHPTQPAQGSLETNLRAIAEPWNAHVASDKALPKALTVLFGPDGLADPTRTDGKSNKLERTHTVRAQCCGQFVVSRERIHSHTRAEYIAIRQWLLDGSEDNKTAPRTGYRGGAGDRTAPPNDLVAGRVLSYVWHILFLDHVRNADDDVDLQLLNRAACPSAEECYCRLYGRCGLKGCRPDRCPGQYLVPKDFKLPDGWEEDHYDRGF